MDIYKKKSRTKKLIVLAAIAIAVISLLFTNRLSHKIADEEEAKVRLWAEALALLFFQYSASSTNPATTGF